MSTPLALESWTATRLGRLFERVSDRGHSDAMVLSVYRDYGVIPKDSRTDNFNRTPENLGNYQLVLPGDLVVNRMKAWQGSLGISAYEGIVSPDYEVLRPIAPAYDRRFLHSLLRSRGLIDQYALRSTGIRPSQWRLYWDEMKTVEVSLPSTEDQRAIADFLDSETARIDTLIEEQQRLIEMLRERRVAAVVDAFASMRGEGGEIGGKWNTIPWLPELRIKRVQMRHVCAIGTGSSDSVNATDEGYPFFVRGDQPLALEHYEFDTEAIITAGDGAMVGRSFHHYQGKFAAHQRVYVLRDFQGVFPRYLYWYFSTFFIRVVGDGGAQATVPSVRRPMIAGMPVPLPSLDEQRRVAALLDEQTIKIDVLIAEAERFIELARERRSALITAAVTGQIDVHEVA
ncbi:restriction endonuclease subunit S [Streptomyces sp. NPDC091383]|uniref:restriction endonuclease subunit S n=1 Tax=Streptomyces sp. NPDC091383 TaxID=3365996 RepID=UPI0037F9C9AF